MKYIISILFIFVSLYGNSQIKLLQMEYAAGADSIIVTDASGVPVYRDYTWLQDTLLFVDSIYITQDSIINYRIDGTIYKDTITISPTGGSGATQLSELSDVNTSTPTNRNFLIADGVDWESRAATEADISDLTHLTQENVEDYAGGMVSGNTETGITVTYQDADGTLDFVTTDQSATNEIQTISGGQGITSTPSGNNYTISVTDNTLDEPMLKSSNSPTDNYYLTYNAATTGFTWVVEPTLTETQDFQDVTDIAASTTNAITTSDITISDATPVLEFDGSGTDWQIGFNTSDGLHVYPGTSTDANGFNIMQWVIPGGMEYRHQFVTSTTGATEYKMYDSAESNKFEVDVTTSGTQILLGGDNGASGEVITSNGTYASWGTVDAMQESDYPISQSKYSSTQTITGSTSDLCELSQDFTETGITINATTDEFETTTAGKYKCTFSGWVYASAAYVNTVWEWELDNVATGYQWEHNFLGQDQMITGTAILTLSAGDDISLEVDVGTGSIYIEEMIITIEKIR